MSGARPVFLTGFMGSGKSAVGRLAAARLGRAFVDVDELVESRVGRTIQDIFATEGEPRFRELERDALWALDGRTDVVVGTGGGLWLSPAARGFMRTRGPVVWLDVSLAAAQRRVGAGRDRPAWPGDDPVGLRALFERRRAAYALATRRVAADGAADAVAEGVLRAVAEVERAEFP